MNEIDVIEELLDTEPFLRRFPTLGAYVEGLWEVGVRVGLDEALNLYTSHLHPGDVRDVMGVYNDGL